MDSQDLSGEQTRYIGPANPLHAFQSLSFLSLLFPVSIAISNPFRISGFAHMVSIRGPFLAFAGQTTASGREPEARSQEKEPQDCQISFKVLTRGLLPNDIRIRLADDSIVTRNHPKIRRLTIWVRPTLRTKRRPPLPKTRSNIDDRRGQ